MPARTDSFDLGRLRLTSGEGRRLELDVALDALQFGGETYEIEPPVVTAVLDISCMTRGGYALRLRFDASLRGPCMRCLEPARAGDRRRRARGRPARRRRGAVEPVRRRRGARPARLGARRARARAARAAAVPARTASGCARSAAPTSTRPAPEHGHEREPDPRWAKLSELKLD